MHRDRASRVTPCEAGRPPNADLATSGAPPLHGEAAINAPPARRPESRTARRPP
ncbi:MerR family transcriptional regulator [Burkholderia thailandensis]|nr:MerR family transcriptional regulator [Burkholderia thailandensis]MDD1483574.1 MerR family transcriptional regulator [Burkholderia thailandensis]MDD1489661.1 MerR family transcriptional regulator [Burkholderia thailandensis]MDD1495776.1 MerR family transcriptional regulator [Burkholderia thailandensis]PJO69778.1 MerR family transcriptional regulator [Burkholderia thailandensis]